MGLKLESLIVLAIVAILSFTFLMKTTDSTISEKCSTKDLEFTNTILTEVDTDTMLGRAFGTHGILDKKVLTLYNLTYHTKNIELLRAKKGIYHGDELYLEGNITVNQKEGFDYNAEYAVYHKKTKVIDINSPFTGIMNQNIIRGNSLHYDIEKKEVFAQSIEAVVYTTEK